MDWSSDVCSSDRGGRRVIIAGYTNGARERLRTVLAEHGVVDIDATETWPEVQGLDSRVVAAAVLPIENGFVADDLAVIAEQDIFGDRLARPARKRRRSDEFIAEVS